MSGKLAEMGLGWEDCRQLNPRLIYASITGASCIHGDTYVPVSNEDGVIVVAGYGQTGPFRKAAGYDVIVEAEAGLMHMCVFVH